MKLKLSVGLFLVGLVLLPGCIKVPTYRKRSFQSFTSHFDYVHTDQKVTLCAKRLNTAEKDYLFNGRDGLLEVEIIYMSIHNFSDTAYTISPHTIDLIQIPYPQVNKMIKKTSTAARFAGNIVSYGASVGTAQAISHAIAAPGCRILLPLFVPMAAAAGIFSYVFLGSGIKSAVINGRIARDLKEKALHSDVLIQPTGYYNCLIFVHKHHYKSQFNAILHSNNNADLIVFNVKI